MRARSWWLVASLGAGASGVVLACGTDHQGSRFDGGTDPDVEASPLPCIADFPCQRPFQCAGPSSYLPLATQDCHVRCGPGACSGESCEIVGPSVACPDATVCITNPPLAYTGPACGVSSDWTCIPGDAAAFDASAGPYAAPAQSACSPQDISDYLASCVHGSNNLCLTYRNSHKACSFCLQGPLGPLTDRVAQTGNNVPGCLALVTGDSSPTSCAARLAASEGCVVEACAACMTQDEVAGCEAHARAGGCAAFSACEPPDGGPTSICFEPNQDKYITTVGALFCSSGG